MQHSPVARTNPRSPRDRGGELWYGRLLIGLTLLIGIMMLGGPLVYALYGTFEYGQGLASARLDLQLQGALLFLIGMLGSALGFAAFRLFMRQLLARMRALTALAK